MCKLELEIYNAILYSEYSLYANRIYINDSIEEHSLIKLVINEYGYHNLKTVVYDAIHTKKDYFQKISFSTVAGCNTYIRNGISEKCRYGIIKNSYLKFSSKNEMLKWKLKHL